MVDERIGLVRLPRRTGLLTSVFKDVREAAITFEPLHLVTYFDIAAIDNGSGEWEYSHMETTLVKADDKSRLCIRGTRKGAKYLVTAENGGWWIMPAPKITVPEKIGSPAGAWELRAATLESFYDKSKTW